MSASIFRIVTCGSVDDGKSTLIGRLIAETLSVPNDILDAARWTRRTGSTIPAGEIDFSLLTDGLEAEREQGITIDVAYRHLDLRNGYRAIIADSPGHEQYTRNMVVAASTADVAILLVDCERGIRTQTFRHLLICSLMRVSEIIVACNKMDSINWNESIFQNISEQISHHAITLGIEKLTFIPVSALTGANVTGTVNSAEWYKGPTLLDALREVSPRITSDKDVVRVSIQNVLRSGNYRGYAGHVLAGTLKSGDSVIVGRSGVSAKVSSLTVCGKPADKAMAGQAVAFTTENEVDIARGDLVLELQSQKYPNNRFLAELVWMNEKPAARGRSYLLISNSQKTIATITTVRDKTDAETGHKQTTRDLKFNEIGTVELATNSPVIFDSYSELRETGSFLLVDRSTNETLAAGMVLHEMRRGKNVHEQTFAIARMNRENQKGHRGQVIWLTGLSGSGKSTIASRLETELHNQGFHTYILDGDNLRLGINKDLGFNSQDRAENVRRVGEIAKLMLDAGLVIIVCLVSPYRGDRDSVRSNFGGDDFIEVYVDTPLEICMERDPKNLYAKANNGEIPNMTGIGQEYEPPLDPEVTVSGTEAIEVSISRILPLITNRKEIL